MDKSNFPIVYKVVLEEDHSVVVGEVVRINEKDAVTKIHPDFKSAPAMFIVAKEMGRSELDTKLTAAFLKDRVIDPGYQGLYLYLKEKNLPCWDLWDMIDIDKGVCPKDRFAIYKESELLEEALRSQTVLHSQNDKCERE